ncbi:MAG: Uma2 family endonuclease [Gemmataceae bacterium]
MPLLMLDPADIAEYRARCDERREESWNGVTVMAPAPNDDHQDLQLGLGTVLRAVVGRNGKVRPSVNISNQAQEWMQNYRVPDIVVYLNTNPATNHQSHWVGGPDLLIEILSPGEDPQAKFGFYASIQTHEILVIERQPWVLELFELRATGYVSRGRTTPAMPDFVESVVLPLSFGLMPGDHRPSVEVRHPVDGRTWSV